MESRLTRGLASEHLHKEAKRNPKLPLRNVLHSVMGMGDLPIDSIVQLRFLAAASQLPDEIIAALEMIGSKHLDYVRDDIERVKEAFTHGQLDQTWSQLSETWLTSGVVSSVRTAAVELSEAEGWNERPIPDGLRARLLSLIREARDAVAGDPDLDVEFRQYLQRALIDIERAVEAYQTDGIRGFSKEYEAIVGRYLADARIREKNWEAKSARKFRRVITSVACVVNFAASVLALTGADVPWALSEADPEFKTIVAEGTALPRGSAGELHAGAVDDDQIVDAELVEPD